MKSIEKLRDLADDINAKEIVEHIQLYPNCVFDCHWLDGWHSEFNRLIESLEAEIAERYMKRPVDADGEPIHMGDTVEGELVFDDATAKGTVTTYHIHDNDEPDTVYIKVDCGNGTWTIKELRIKRCHHVKQRTLEDVLREYGNAYYAHMTDNYMNYDGTDEQVIGKYADEIRELLGGDAE